MENIAPIIEALRLKAQLAADSAASNYETGMRLADGFLEEEGKVYAAEFFQKAAEQDHREAMYELGLCYRWGDGGVYAEPDVAMEWFRKAAALGHEEAKGFVERFDNPNGMNILLMSAMSGGAGLGSKWFKAKAGVELYYAEAEAGNAECQYELARQLADPYHLGPFKQDMEQAIYWYTKAAENGVVDAMFNLAHIYYKGTDVYAPNYDAAKLWFTEAAQAGDMEAAAILADESFWK